MHDLVRDHLSLKMSDPSKSSSVTEAPGSGDKILHLRLAISKPQFTLLLLFSLLLLEQDRVTVVVAHSHKIQSRACPTPDLSSAAEPAHVRAEGDFPIIYTGLKSQ